MLEVCNVTKLYGRTVGVRSITFSVASGEVVGLLGPNGAGKTTTMRVMTGFFPSTEGTVKVAGFDVVAQPLEARRHLGYLPEAPPLYPEMTVGGYLNFVARVREVPARQRRERIAAVLAQLDLEPVARRLVGNLSKGYRQRVGLAQALVHDPPVLVLDEPTSSLDPAQIVEMRRIIRQLGETRAVILSSHILAEVEQVCARVVILKQGQVVAADRTDRLVQLLRRGTRLRIQVRGPKDRVEAVLRGVGGLARWALRDVGEDGLVRGTLEPEPGVEIREALFFRLAEAGCPLLELRPEAPGLESVFMELTAAEGQAGSGNGTGVATAGARAP